jgi:precorrin-2/cobalt-factor-2 C20-methyltransferase
LITVKALKILQGADLVLTPTTDVTRPSIADRVIRAHLSLETIPVIFPMTRNQEARDALLREQLVALRSRWRGAKRVVLPVIGDSALYATAAYFYDVWKTLEPSLDLELTPGVSAHSLASACSGRFLALGEAVFSIIPGTARPDAIIQALRCCSSAALYKPSALKNLREVVESAGPWREMLRVDRGGLPDERVIQGDAALFRPDGYLSTLLLWRNAGDESDLADKTNRWLPFGGTSDQKSKD